MQPQPPSTYSNNTTPPYPALTIDWEKYLGQLEDLEVAEDQKREFIAALWGLLVACAEIGMRVHPLQNIEESGENPCGKLEDNSPKAALTAPSALYLDDLILNKYNAGVADESPSGQESS